MNLLVLKGFNNYFNRIIKKYSTLADYISHSGSYYDFANINFNPNDGVTTTQILGSENQKDAGGPDLVPLAWEKDGNPDYIIAYETEQVGIATNTVIRSRWFIVESVRTRNGQYSLKLKRDSIADHLETLSRCPAYIKKGIVDDDNPLILNDERVTVNQIKQGQEYLTDALNSAWIVGYMPKNTGLSGHTISATVQGESNVEYITIEDLASDLGIDEVDLNNALTEDTANITKFINGNIEVGGYLNHPNPVRTVERLSAISQNYLTSASAKSWSESSSSIVASKCFADRKAVYGMSSYNNKCAELWRTAVNGQVGGIKSNWHSLTNQSFLPRMVYDRLNQLVGTYIKKNGQYYKLHSGTSNSGHVEVFVSNAETPFNTICSNMISDWNLWIAEQSGYDATRDNMTIRTPGQVQIYYNTIEQCFYLTPIGPEDGFPTVSFSMSSNRRACYDQCYDIFAIPYGELEIIDGLNTYNGIGNYAQRLAVAIAGAAESLDNDNPDLYALYDIQLLPYCPIPKAIKNGQFDLDELDSDEYDLITYTGPTNVREEAIVAAYTNEYAQGQWEGVAEYQSDVTDSDLVEWGYEIYASHDIELAQEWIGNCQATKTVVGGKSKFTIYAQIQDEHEFDDADISVRFWFVYTKNATVTKSIVIYPSSASFEVSVGHSLSLRDEMKIEAICNNYRLVAPNYQGSFDFNVAKNKGSCSGFVANCTYKPYTPYIRVVPLLNWMYGQNFAKEARGLICNGDYSLGRVNTQWAQYQLNNKNYQNIFNREIQNLDVSQSIQRTQQYVSGGLNIVRDAIAGGVGGGLATGSPYGAIAGAVVGGAGSGIGYAMDMNLMEKGLQEQRQYAIDKYNLQLGNIKAIPYTLTKVGAFDKDSAIFPVLEYYSCTPEEKELLRNKFKYESYTLGVIDALGNYFLDGKFVQADLIRNETIIEDSHLLDDIYIELTKGVYM